MIAFSFYSCFSMDCQDVNSRKKVLGAVNSQETECEEPLISSPSDTVRAGNFDDLPKSLWACIRQKTMDSDIIHSLLVSRHLDIVYKRKDFIVLILSFLKAYYGDDVKKNFLNNKCRVTFENCHFTIDTTPLNLALNFKYLDIAALLLAEGADISISDSNNKDPMSLLLCLKCNKPEDETLKQGLLTFMTDKFKELSSDSKVSLLNKKS